MYLYIITLINMNTITLVNMNAITLVNMNTITLVNMNTITLVNMNAISKLVNEWSMNVFLLQSVASIQCVRVKY